MRAYQIAAGANSLDGLKRVELSDHRLMRRLDVEKRIMRAAVFLDPVSCGLKTPIFGLPDLAAMLLDDGFIGVHKPGHLLRRDILARKKSMLVKWHIGLSLRFNGIRRIAPVKPRKGVEGS